MKSIAKVLFLGMLFSFVLVSCNDEKKACKKENCEMKCCTEKAG